MKEVVLYACDVCSTVKMYPSDTSTTKCVWCGVCKECQFHNKIVGYRVPEDGEKSETQIIFVVGE
jgi:hypothetical protein